MAEGYQQEFQQLTEGETQATPEAAPATPEEMIEVMLGNQRVKIPVSTEIPFKHNGTIAKAPFSKLLNGYRQQEHMEKRMNEYKALKDSLEKERGDIDTYKALRQKYEAIQQWSEANPDQWERLYALWQDKENALKGGATQGGQDPEVLRMIESLRKDNAELRGMLTPMIQERDERKTESDIAQVKAEIDTFKKDFPEINLDEKDEEGVTLQARIITFGIDNGFQEFEGAALKYLKPRLLETIQTRGRNEAVKGFKKDNAQGIVSRSNEPQLVGGQRRTEIDPKKLSWEALKDAARQEFEALSKE